MPKLSVIITAKNIEDKKLKDLEYSLTKQTFQDFEKLIITEGNSETAKAIGLKRAKGEYICILASDNYLNDTKFFEKCIEPLNKDSEICGSFPIRYWYYKKDNILNRYFSLFGVNDPIPLFLRKNDRASYYDEELFGYPFFLFNKDRHYLRIKLNSVPTLGDNGFFIRKDILMQANIDNYFHIDVCQDIFNLGYYRYAIVNTSIWHRTGGNIIKFFLKRFRYADKLSKNRRWQMVEKKDLFWIFMFIISTITMAYPLYLSFKGYKRIKDLAWFLHLPICFISIGVYGLWTLKRVLSFALTKEKKA